MTHNHSSMINGIKMIIENTFEVDSDLIDLESEIDDTLTYKENLNYILNKFWGWK